MVMRRHAALRILWIAIRIGLAIIMMGRGSYFLYQGF
jgi:hypothetical protein